MSSAFQAKGSNQDISGVQQPNERNMKIERLNQLTDSFDRRKPSQVTENSQNNLRNSASNLDYQQSSSQKGATAHYEVPILSSMLYEYTNKEYDIVKNAFRPSNYHSLRDLPNSMTPFTVSQSIKERLQNGQLQASVTGQNNKAANELLKDNGGLFQKFEWMADEYGTEKKAEQTAKKAREDKVFEVHDMPFNPAQVKKTLKYDFPFLGRNETSTYSFLSAGDPYEVVREDKMRARWIEEAKLLFGDFVPAGATKPIQTITRSTLPDIVDVIKKLLLSDWNDINFVIGTNPQDFIEVKFDISTVDNLQGLHCYMNTLINNNDDLQRFQIRRVSFYWGFQEGSFVYYMFSPPWIRLIVNDPVNQLATKGTSQRVQQAIKGQPTGFNSASKRPQLYSKEINID